MTSEEFHQLVDRIQSRYGARPLALRSRIVILLALGYLGFFTVIALVLILAIGLGIGAAAADQAPSVLLVGMIAVLLTFGLCQAIVFLWVPLNPPEGRELLRSEVPELFCLLDRLQADLKTIPFHHVRINADFNCSIQTIPTLGVFGWHRCYLCLGLPMLQVLSREQFEAVLAHEAAHCSSRHDRFGMWIYRLRMSWSRVFDKLHTSQPGTIISFFRWMFLKFVDWYWPRFNAYAFVLSRANEYEADRVAVEWVNALPAAEALFRTECFGVRLNDQFWTDLTESAKKEPTVPDDIVDRMVSILNTEIAVAISSRYLTQATQKLTSNIDTHPSLADRLKALGFEVDQFLRSGFPRPPAICAADVLLGPAMRLIAHDVNADWQKGNTLRWQNVFHQARRLERQYDSRNDGPQVDQDAGTKLIDPAAVEKLWEKAKAICDLQSVSAAELLLRNILDHMPDHLLANMTLGSHLIERHEVEGEQRLLRVLENEDNELVFPACQRLLTYYQQVGQPDKVRDMLSHLSRLETAQTEAAKERSMVTATDRFVSHGLIDSELDHLKRKLRAIPQLQAAWLVRKQVKHFPNRPLFVLVVRTRSTGLFGSSNAQEDRRLVATLIPEVTLPGRVLIVAPHDGFRRLGRKIMVDDFQIL